MHVFFRKPHLPCFHNVCLLFAPLYRIIAEGLRIILLGTIAPFFFNQAKAMFPDVHVKEGLHPGLPVGYGHATRAT